MKNPNYSNIINHINTIVQTQSIRGRKSKSKTRETMQKVHANNGNASLKDNFGGAF